MKRSPFLARLRYAFDNTLSQGPLALIGWLGLAAVVMVVAASLVVLAMHAAGGREMGGVFWDILSQALTPNPVDAHNPWQFLAVMFVVTLGSLFMVSVLIGVLTTSIEQRVEALQRGRSKVIEDGHIIILGWNEQVFAVISELVVANANRRSCIAILGEKDKVEMETVIRDKVGHTGRTRVVCRTGNPIDLTDLEIINLDTARAIIVLGSDEDDPDSGVIKTILAITNNPHRRAHPYHIVAEINDPKNMEVARLVGGQETELVLTDTLIARIIAQTSRHSGLSVIYSDMLDFSGDEIHFYEEPALVGKTFGEALLSYEDSAVLGICPNGGVPKLNPPMDTRIGPGDQIIAVSEDDDTLRLSGLADYRIAAAAIREHVRERPQPQATLVLGWNKRAPEVISQLDNYVAPGSSVTVVGDRPELAGEAAWCCPDLLNQTVRFQAGDTTNRRLLDSLGVEHYQHVVVLPYSDSVSAQKADARTLITLLHLRDMSAHSERGFAIVSEMLDLRNRALAEVTRADDFIVSDRLVSLMLAQIAENKELNAVFDDLFDPAGSDIYPKPAENYVAMGEPVNFYTVVESARRRGEVAFGYRVKALANDAEHSHGLMVNPDKSAPITFAPGDQVVVLAES
ncbi:MAG: potassium transporter TrkA [Anaerolineales bacterium]